MRKEPPKNSWEYNWCSPWRFFLKYTHNHSGAGKRVKRAMNKRTRRKGKREVTNP